MNEKKDSKVYLISWDDDNHEKIWYLNTDYLGCDFVDVIRSALALGHELPLQTQVEYISLGIETDFPEDITEELFDYFQTIPTLDTQDIELIAKAVDNELFWQEFYEKNIKK